MALLCPMEMGASRRWAARGDARLAEMRGSRRTMPSPLARRLDVVVSHVATAAADADAVQAERGGPQVAAADAEAVPGLLSKHQLRTFVRDGVLAVRVPEHEFPHNDRVYSEARQGVAEMTDADGRGYNINLSNGTPERRFAWSDLPAVSDVCGAPSVVGALTSVLGEGYSMHPHRALHNNAGNVDQMFHKDGHHVGERDHRPRWIMGLWFPHAVTISMGPTVVVPGSQFYSVDREYWWDLLPEEKREAAPAALAGGSRAARDEVLDTAAATFGGAQRKIEVEAGSFVLMHFDLIHRGSRQAFTDVEIDGGGALPFAIAPDIAWRPMFKLQFYRVQEPDQLHVQDDTSATEEEEVAAAAAAVAALPSAAAEAVFRWLAGTTASAAAAGGKLDDLRVALRQPGVEAEPQRIDAAYRLGMLAAAAAEDSDSDSDSDSAASAAAAAVGALTDAFESGKEATRRAAQYGLAAAGMAAVPQLTQLIAARRQHLERQMPLHLQACEADGATQLVRSWVRQLCKLTHALGEAAETPSTEHALTIQGIADIASYVGGVHTDEAVEWEARRLRTVAMTALGCLGGRAVQRDDAELCALLAEQLVACVNSGSGDERAAQARAQGAAGAATREAAAHGLLRLSGAPHATATMGSVVDSRSSGRHTHASFVPGFCADAIRRLDALATGSSDSQRCVRQALEELEFEPEEWADGWALFEEGASRAAMQD